VITNYTYFHRVSRSALIANLFAQGLFVPGKQLWIFEINILLYRPIFLATTWLTGQIKKKKIRTIMRADLQTMYDWLIFFKAIQHIFYSRKQLNFHNYSKLQKTCPRYREFPLPDVLVHTHSLSRYGWHSSCLVERYCVHICRVVVCIRQRCHRCTICNHDSSHHHQRAMNISGMASTSYVRRCHIIATSLQVYALPPKLGLAWHDDCHHFIGNVSVHWCCAFDIRNG